MEAKTSLIGTDGTVELDTIAGIGLDLSPIVYPGYAESKDAVRLYQPFHNLGLFKLRMLVVHILDRLQNFLYGLQVFLFQGILGLKACHDVSCFHYKNDLLVLWLQIKWNSLQFLYKCKEIQTNSQ